MEVSGLLERCKKGDRQALDLLYSRYKPHLLQVCRQYAGDDSVAEDLLHDAFVIILTSLHSVRDADKLESWMVTIVKNTCYHYREHQKTEQVAMQQLADDNLHAETMLAPDYEQLQTLVNQLPKGYQQVFRLSVFEGLSHQRISHLLGIEPHSSSSQLSHAKRRIQMLIRQSLIFVFLLLAIPATIWWLMQKEEEPTKVQQTAVQTVTPVHQPDTAAERQLTEPVPVAVVRKPHVAVQQSAVTAQPDTIVQVAKIDSVPTSIPVEETTTDTLREERVPLPPSLTPEPSYTAAVKPKALRWNVMLAYNGQIGQQTDYLGAAYNPLNHPAYNIINGVNADYGSLDIFNNWANLDTYLNNKQGFANAEASSLMTIAARNASVNNGKMETQHHHYQPFSIQLLVSRQLNSRLSVETGLSYTQLKSTYTTGIPAAHVLNQQRLRYLGIPLRLRWQWYNKSRLSFYASAGAMWELPVRSKLNVQHVADGQVTFQRDETLDVPHQWSTTLGVGVQYDLTPRLGIYMEPSLQYFFDDGSGLKSYRTEHSLNVTLPLGIRLHW